LKEGTFYIHAIVWASSRTAIASSMTLLPFYLTVVLKYNEKDGQEI
jgi:hypothetical protein